MFVTRHVDRFVIYEFDAQRTIHVDSDRITEYYMKLMGIDSDTLAIPETKTNHVLLWRPANRR